MKKLSQEEFLLKAKNKHKNKYDYSITEYINSRTKVKIICPSHGIFYQQANSHLSGVGCRDCQYNDSSINNTYTNEIFIKKAKEKHNNNYIYSKVEYKNSQIKVIIICKKHGEFKQSPYSHIAGHGCPKCFREYKINLQRKSQEVFLTECNKIHNDKYDYTITKYKNSHDFIKYKCKEHGIIKQKAYSHLYGHGCPKCANKKDNENRKEIIFYNNLSNLFPDLEIIRNDRTIIKPLELDFYIPILNLAFEYNEKNGHREGSEKPFGYHDNKIMLCEKQNINLIHVWE